MGASPEDVLSTLRAEPVPDTEVAPDGTVRNVAPPAPAASGGVSDPIQVLRNANAQQNPGLSVTAQPSPAAQGTAPVDDPTAVLRAAVDEELANKPPLINFFNRGLLYGITAPTDIWNLAGQYGPAIPIPLPNALIRNGRFFIPGSEDLHQIAADAGVSVDPSIPAETIAERSLEFIGSAALFELGTAAKGQSILQQAVPQNPNAIFQNRVPAGPAPGAIRETTGGFRPSIRGREFGPRIGGTTIGPRPQFTPGQQFFVEPALHPYKSAAIEALASVGASTAREVGQGFTDDPAKLALWELGGGLGVPGVSATLGVKAFRVAEGRLPQALGRLGGERRAGASVDARGVNREAVIAGLDRRAELFTEGLSEARISGDRRALGLERDILNEIPELEDLYTAELRRSLENLRAQSETFGGDSTRPGTVLEDQQRYHMNLLETRARMAAEDAAIAVQLLGRDANYRDISAAARTHIDAAYNAARALEQRKWGDVNRQAPASLDNARQELANIEASLGVFDQGLIPQWLRNDLALPEPDPEVLQAVLNRFQVQSIDDLPQTPQGIQARQIIEQSVPAEELTFNDIHGLRIKLREAIVAERAAINRGGRSASPRRLRILNQIEQGSDPRIRTGSGEQGERPIGGILKDMGAVNDPAVAGALAYSNQTAERFTRGNVGRFLGFDATNTPNATPEDLLPSILEGRTPVTGIEEVLNAAPGARDDVLEYARLQFLMAAGGTDRFSEDAAGRWIDNARAKGVFDVLPELEQQLTTSTTAILRDQAMQDRLIRSPEIFDTASRKARAAVYLNADPGAEMMNVLNATNPVVAARSLVVRMGGDQVAINGLKSQFAESLWLMSQTGRIDDAGFQGISGSKYTRLLNENKDVMSALGMTGEEQARMRRIANTLRRHELQPAGQQGNILSDKGSRILDLMIRVVGASSGARASELGGGSLGGGIILAGDFADEARQSLQRWTNSGAQTVLVNAHLRGNEEAYRALMTPIDAPPEQLREAFRRLNLWMVEAVPPPEEQQ